MTLRPDLELVASLIPSGSRVLDLGCGSGALLSDLMHSRELPRHREWRSIPNRSSRRSGSASR